MTEKDKKIITDAKKTGTPIFVFTAKDKLAYDAVLNYFISCTTHKCSSKHCEGVNERAREFYAWQRDNSDKVKLPD